MFHISNINEAKSEWNLNETHIIIPMIDGDVINKESDKILTSSFALNPLEGGDQAMLTSALEHSFVIGLDRNLFESPSCKSDLVIIQNSDLKLLSSNSDLKNPVAYALSYIDQDKSEILWQSSVQKDRTCASEKAILDVRDELDYQNSMQGLEKNEQSNLANVDSDIASSVSKTDDEILHEEILKENEKPQIIHYHTVAQNSETVLNLHILDSTKCTESSKPVNVEKLVNCNFNYKQTDKGSLCGVKNSLENLFNDTHPVTECNESQSVNLNKFIKLETEKKEVIVNNKIKNAKVEKLEEGETYKGVSNSLPEKSLPLKKKAKMKRTLMSYNSENQRSLLKQDMTAVNQKINMKSLTGRKIKQQLLNNLHKEQDQSQSDSDAPLINKVAKKRKTTKLKNKSKKYVSVSIINENPLQKFQKQESAKTGSFGFDKNKLCNIYDLVECLKKYKVINTSIWQTLNSGLREMNVDILKEMNTKKSEKRALEGTNFSPQLKAFALILYFKQPAAFNYLSQIYGDGWPSLKTIKEWKRRINSHQRPNFLRIQRHQTPQILK